MLLTLTTVRRLTVLVFLFLAWTPAAYAWSWPVQGTVLQPFSYDETHPYAAGQHRGIDIGADSAGETVIAPAAGTVSFAGTVPTSGKSVTIETADGYSVTLTHLGSIALAKGSSVAEGAIVGTIGPSGTPEVDGPYLHLGVRLTADSNGYVDPLGLLPPLPVASTTGEESAAAQSSSSGISSTASGSASSASAPAPPASQPATTDPASKPGSSNPAGSTTTRVPAREASHARERGSQPRAETRLPSHPHSRVEVQPGRESLARSARTARTARPTSTATGRRPVVETAAAPVEPTPLGAGHEIRPSAPVSSPAPAPRPAPGSLLSLILNGAAATLAVGAALLAERRRRVATATAAAKARVLQLPPRLVERRPASRAA